MWLGGFILWPGRSPSIHKLGKTGDGKGKCPSVLRHSLLPEPFCLIWLNRVMSSYDICCHFFGGQGMETLCKTGSNFHFLKLYLIFFILIESGGNAFVAWMRLQGSWMSSKVFFRALPLCIFVKQLISVIPNTNVIVTLMTIPVEQSLYYLCVRWLYVGSFTQICVGCGGGLTVPVVTVKLTQQAVKLNIKKKFTLDPCVYLVL